MEQLFSSGRIVDLILALMLAEYLLIRLYARSRRIAMPSLRLPGFLLSGAFLMLALRAALTGGHWTWIAGFLGASFVVHLLDLRGRLADGKIKPDDREAPPSSRTEISA